MIADEPTSALDPEGEFELFSRLRKESEGRTAIFVTHRFGHLTKHADLILCVFSYQTFPFICLTRRLRCLKEGELVESGTHDELIAKGGEYTKLHGIQARAFARE